MGYRKLSNGEWEQPAQAESRVLRRKFATVVLYGALLGGSAAGTAYGVYEMATSNVGQSEEQTDHGKLFGGFMIAAVGAVASFVFGGALSFGVNTDNNSLTRIRRDIQDGVQIVHGQPVLPDYMPQADEPTQTRQPV